MESSRANRGNTQTWASTMRSPLVLCGAQPIKTRVSVTRSRGHVSRGLPMGRVVLSWLAVMACRHGTYQKASSRASHEPGVVHHVPRSRPLVMIRITLISLSPITYIHPADAVHRQCTATNHGPPQEQETASRKQVGRREVVLLILIQMSVSLYTESLTHTTCHAR